MYTYVRHGEGIHVGNTRFLWSRGRHQETSKKPRNLTQLGPRGRGTCLFNCPSCRMSTGAFQNRGMPETSLSKKPGEKHYFWRFPVQARVKHIQFLVQNPIFRSKIANSGKQSRAHGKPFFFNIIIF